MGQATDAPLRDLTLYKPIAEGRWRTGTLASLARAANAPRVSQIAAATATAEGAEPQAVSTTQLSPFGAILSALAGPAGATPTMATATMAAPTNTAPAPLPVVQLAGTDLALGTTSATGDEALAPWRKQLAEAGVSSADQEVALKILARYALDAKRLTAIYRIDGAEFDKLLPLEIVPQPKKISRIALVVVTGIDPAIDEEVDQWIAQLGSPAWKTREAAMVEIKKLGAAARPHLERALKNKDTEIVYRAEQLLDAISNGERDHAPR